MRRLLAGLVFGLAFSGGAYAQTAPSPADVGISKGTPDIFKLKGHDNAWTPFGSVDSSTHVFAPATNGNIAPNDCVKWGPGLTSAGAACNSVTGGATPANQLTIYTNHAGLVANVTTPTEAWTVQQQGFYAPGDGGQATYQWNLTSLCPLNDETGLHVAADGLYCVLPAGQSPSTPGRYILQLDPSGFNVRQIGMLGDGVFDNYPLVATLNNILNPAYGQTSNSTVLFPVTVGQYYTDYYFSKSFEVTGSMNIVCQGVPNGGGDASTRLIFAPGVHGVKFDNAYASPAGQGIGGGGMTGCGVVSQGQHDSADVTAGSNVFHNVRPARNFPSMWDFEVGDGIILWTAPLQPHPLGPGGTVITAVDSVAKSITLNLDSGHLPTLTRTGAAIWRLPKEDAYTVKTTSGQPLVLVTGGPYILQAGDFVWSDAFVWGKTVLNAWATSTFTQTSSNNFQAGDSLNIAGYTYHFVSSLGSTPGNVLVGGSFAASATNLVAAVNNSGGGNYVPVVPGVNLADAITGAWPASATTINFTAHVGQGHPVGGYTYTYSSTYTPSGTSAGSFQAATFNEQTVDLTDYPLNYYNTINASVSHLTASSCASGGGCLWIIPSGIKAFTTTSLKKNYISNWGQGLQMECSSWSATFAPAGCNDSMAEENQFIIDIIGRMVQGDNAGASTSIQNIYNGAAFADIVEGGAVGSTYYNENANSQENQSGLYGAVGECIGSNSSAFFGGYITTTGGYCLNSELGVAPTPGGVTFYAPQAASPTGAPAIYNSNIIGTWLFRSADAEQTELCMNMPDAPISWSRGGIRCGGPYSTWQFLWDPRGRWTVGYAGADAMSFIDPSVYHGYPMSRQAIGFSQGFLISSFDGGYDVPGVERMLDGGFSVPTLPFHQWGDISLNQGANIGGNLAWVDTYSSVTTLSAAIVSGTTTTVPIAACPSPVPPVGTPIVRYVNQTSREDPLGTLASCTGGILTFQAAATSAAASGDQILFMQWLPAGPVANDSAGTHWTLGNYMTLTPVALASLPATCTAGTFAVINNGVASPTYNAAVGATTGAATDPVFCTAGNVWTYH